MSTDILKVPFQDALDLVRTRKVYLKAGYAYIPHQDIVTIVLNDFRTRLSKALAVSFLSDSFTLSMNATYIIMYRLLWYSRMCFYLNYCLCLSSRSSCFCCHPVAKMVNGYTVWSLIRFICLLKIRCIVFSAKHIHRFLSVFWLIPESLILQFFFPSFYKCMFMLIHPLCAVCLVLYSTFAACCSHCCRWCPEGSGVNVMSRWEECVWHEMSWGSMYEHVPAGLLVIPFSTY